jgi:hypothetical protein
MFVGHATAIGQPLNLPIILRSLADSLVFLKEDKLPLRFHDTLLANLETGLKPKVLGALVKKYLCDWWNHPASAATADILTFENLQAALDCHKAQLDTTGQPPIETFCTPQPRNNATNCSKCEGYKNLAG